MHSAGLDEEVQVQHLAMGRRCWHRVEEVEPIIRLAEEAAI